MIGSRSDTPHHPEFSSFISCEKRPADGKSYRVEASTDECAALAERLSIDKLDNLKATFLFGSDAAGLILLTGRLEATVRQTCVVSLEPVVSDIDVSFKRTYSASAAAPEKQYESDEDVFSNDDEATENAPDPPDLLENGGIDLGEVAAEELAVEINPFPRLADVEFGAEPDNSAEHRREVTKNPFAVLEKLKKKLR